MAKQDIINMKKYVIEAYQELYNCDFQEALRDVDSSSFVITLAKNPQYVMHYDDEYWAKKVRYEKEEISKKKICMMV